MLCVMGLCQVTCQVGTICLRESLNCFSRNSLKNGVFCNRPFVPESTYSQEGGGRRGTFLHCAEWQAATPQKQMFMASTNTKRRPHYYARKLDLLSASKTPHMLWLRIAYHQGDRGGTMQRQSKCKGGWHTSDETEQLDMEDMMEEHDIVLSSRASLRCVPSANLRSAAASKVEKS